MRAVASFTIRPHLPGPIGGLDELAANLRWSWNRPTRELFRSIDPEAWAECGHDPRLLLARTDPDRLEALAQDAGFRQRVDDAVADLHRALGPDSWFEESGRPIDGSVAYFSPEFGIAEAVPQYSGGLGILAGDHLKSCSDLGIPLVGVGLFYRHGYFRQSVSVDGWQQERFPDLDPYAMSMHLVEDIRIELDLAGERLVAQVWQAQVGRTPLYLLDSDVDDNPDHLRVICDRLYGGDTEHRLRQEILLGIGGIRMLAALGIDATVFHTNEGHAGFLGLERIRVLMTESHVDFGTALAATRAGCVFTTHTPVPAGIDRFGLDLIDRYFGAWADEVGIDRSELIGLGHRPGDGPEEPFNMAVMGMRLAQRRNGVAALHGEVSREMFADLWPGVPTDEVPIGSVTNGVHGATWVSAEMDRVLSAAAGTAWSAEVRDTWDLDRVNDRDLWAAHRDGTHRLIDFTRARLRSAGLTRGLSPAELSWTDEALDPNALTICFARRFATYKRATLLLSQPERLMALISDAERPVQFVFAGKAHPADEPGKQLIRDIVTLSHDPAARHRFCFIEDYDMAVSRHLLHGADVWLNTPLRPQEACGTSGMKATMNGALNCSIADGWWAECLDPELGWTISSADGIDDLARRNELEANSLFELLEQHIVPLFHHGMVAGQGSPGWLAAMRRSVGRVGPFVSSARMVQDYTRHFYGPASNSARLMESDGHRVAREVASWQRRVVDAWHRVHVDQVMVDESLADLGSVREVSARVFLGDLDPLDVSVQLISGTVGQSGTLESSVLSTMELVGDSDDGHRRYAAQMLLDRAGRAGLTVRIVPRHDAVADPLDLGCVAWAG